MAWMTKGTIGPLLWVNPSLGGTTNNHLKEWLRNKKTTKLFSWSFSFECFYNYKLLFFHVYPLQALIYDLVLI